MDNLQNFRRTGYCGTFTAEDIGKTVSVCGWVQRQRNLGGLIFVDLRDRTGLLQLSFDDSTPRDIFEKAAGLLIGPFTDLKNDYEEGYEWHDVLLDIFRDLPIPLIAGVASGHEHPMMTLPMGAFCEMDADAKTIRFRIDR